MWYFSHQSRIIPSCYKKDGFIVFLASSFHLRSTVSPISCLYTKWVSCLIVRGLFYPLMSISLGNLVSAIEWGTITYCSNTLNTRYSIHHFIRGCQDLSGSSDQHCPWLTFWTLLFWSQPSWISSLRSAEGWCHPLVSTASHPRTMARGCLHREWSLSIFRKFSIHGGPGRTGM